MKVDITFNKLPCSGKHLYIKLLEYNSEMNFSIYSKEYKALFLCTEFPKMEISKNNIKEVQIEKFKRNYLLLILDKDFNARYKESLIYLKYLFIK